MDLFKVHVVIMTKSETGRSEVNVGMQFPISSRKYFY